MVVLFISDPVGDGSVCGATVILILLNAHFAILNSELATVGVI